MAQSFSSYYSQEFFHLKKQTNTQQKHRAIPVLPKALLLLQNTRERYYQLLSYLSSIFFPSNAKEEKGIS